MDFLIFGMVGICAMALILIGWQLVGLRDLIALLVYQTPGGKRFLEKRGKWFPGKEPREKGGE